MNDMLCPSSREDLSFEELDGEIVIFDPSTQLTHRLNHSAALIFLSCDGKTPLAEIRSLYQNSFQLPDDVADRDVRFVIENLSKSSIVSVG